MNFLNRQYNFIRSSSVLPLFLLLGYGILMAVLGTVSFSFDSAAFLFSLNVRYWSLSTFLVLWLLALWLGTEAAGLTDHYQQFIRWVLGTTCLFLLLQSAASMNGVLTAVIAVVTVCLLRSVMSLLKYRRRQLDNASLEEAQWFWGMTGLMTAALLTAGMMQVIRVAEYADTGAVRYKSLWLYCHDEILLTIRNGEGAMLVRFGGMLTLLVLFVFMFAVYKWGMCFISNIRKK